VLAQQQTVPNPQMQEEADKGAKTRQSGESGYVGEQEKSGASAHAPGRPGESQATTGSNSGTSSTSPPTHPPDVATVYAINLQDFRLRCLARDLPEAFGDCGGIVDDAVGHEPPLCIVGR
jgi:hypothetical protein